MVKTNCNDKLIFTREFWRENGKFNKADVFRESFKGRINNAFKYEPYISHGFMADHLRATDWIFIDESEVSK